MVSFITGLNGKLQSRWVLFPLNYEGVQ